MLVGYWMPIMAPAPWTYSAPEDILGAFIRMFCGIFLQRGALGSLLRTLGSLPQLVTPAPARYRPLGLSFPPEWAPLALMAPSAPNQGPVPPYTVTANLWGLDSPATWLKPRLRQKGPRLPLPPGLGFPRIGVRPKQPSVGARAALRSRGSSTGVAFRQLTRRCRQSLQFIQRFATLRQRGLGARPGLTPVQLDSPAPLSARAARRRRAAARRKASKASKVSRRPAAAASRLMARTHLARFGSPMAHTPLSRFGSPLRPGQLPLSALARWGANLRSPSGVGARVVLQLRYAPIRGAPSSCMAPSPRGAQRLAFPSRVVRPRAPRNVAPRRPVLSLPQGGAGFRAEAPAFSLPPSQFILL